MKNMTISAKLFIGAMVAAGLSVLGGGLTQAGCKDPLRFLSFLIIALIASRLKVKLPGANGSLSVNLPFILIALVQLSFPEALVIAAASALMQGLSPRGRSMNPVQAVFNVAALLVAVAMAELVFRSSALIPNLTAKSLRIALAGAAFLVADTLPLAAVISLTDSRRFGKLWRDMLELLFAYFALSTAIAAVAATTNSDVDWRTPFVVLLVMIPTYISYKRYFRLPAVVAMTNLQFATPPADAREEAEEREYSFPQPGPAA